MVRRDYSQGCMSLYPFRCDVPRPILPITWPLHGPLATLDWPDGCVACGSARGRGNIPVPAPSPQPFFRPSSTLGFSALSEFPFPVHPLPPFNCLNVTFSLQTSSGPSCAAAHASYGCCVAIARFRSHQMHLAIAQIQDLCMNECMLAPAYHWALCWIKHGMKSQDNMQLGRHFFPQSPLHDAPLA